MPLFFLGMLLLMQSKSAWSQTCENERYLQDIFPSAVSTDVVFGNSPALTAVYVAENVTVDQEMTMDIYTPVGDALPKRPAVMLAYGGGYLVGSKEDEDVRATCDSLAKKGYVTASINYRMNMNVSSPASALRAIYRAAQDYSAAIRFLKEKADVYAIDTNYIFIGGVSAGGFSAMHMAFLDENERPDATYQSGLLNNAPDLGCLSCSGNSYQHSHDVRGIINLWGALLDTAFIQEDELVPMTLFHGNNDLIVPYDEGFPFTALFLMPEVHGSEPIAQRVSNLGGQAELNIFDGVGHNIWGVNVNNQLAPGPTEHWVPITDSIISFLYENIRPETPQFAVPSIICAGDTVILSVTDPPAEGSLCWSVDGAAIISASPDSAQIEVVFGTPGQYLITGTAINHLDAFSPSADETVEVYPQPIVSVMESGGTLEADPGFVSYQWYLDGQPLPDADGSQVVPLNGGVYTVEVTDANGCTAVSDGWTAVGLEETAKHWLRRAHRLVVFDLLGREQLRTHVVSLHALSDVLPSGAYLIRAYTKEEVPLKPLKVFLK